MSTVLKWQDIVKHFGGITKAREAVTAGKAKKLETGGYALAK